MRGQIYQFSEKKNILLTYSIVYYYQVRHSTQTSKKKCWHQKIADDEADKTAAVLLYSNSC